MLVGKDIPREGALESLFVFRTDRNGRRVWEHTTDNPGSRRDWGLCAAASPDGSSVFVAGTLSPSANMQRALIKLDAGTGAVIWTKVWAAAKSSSAHDAIESVQITSDGGMVGCGTLGATSVFGFKSAGNVEAGGVGFVMKLSASAIASSSAPSTPEWTVELAGSMTCKAVKERPDGGYVAVASVSEGTEGPKVIWLSSSGALERTVTVAAHPEATDLALDANGNVYVAGHGTSPAQLVGIDGAVSKISASGSYLWTVWVGNPVGGVHPAFANLASGNPKLIYDECWGIAATNAGDGFYLGCGTGIEGCGEGHVAGDAALTAECSGDPRTSWRSLIIKMDTSGTVIWSRVDSAMDTLEPGNAETPSSSASEHVIATRDGGVAGINDEATGIGLLKLASDAVSLPAPPLLAPTTMPAPGSACLAGTPAYIDVIEHCGEDVVATQCDCEQQQWMCLAASLSPCPTSTLPAVVANTGQLACAQLGWTSIVSNVCGESDDRLGDGGTTTSACNEAPFAEAASRCAAAGARLCSIDEVDSGVTAGTGCGFDTSYTWTSTWCGLGPEGGKYYVGMGGGGFPSDRKCKNPKKSYAVRCCSEVNVAAVTPTPATTTTTFPFLSERKTCAALGWTVVGSACGESDKAFKKGLDKCFTNKNHPDAERKCLKLGGRMCSQADIEAGVGKSTGCQFDSKFLWTSTSCGVNSYIQAKGNGDGSTQCRAVKSKGPMRCCSDVSVTAQRAKRPRRTLLTIVSAAAETPRVSAHRKIEASNYPPTKLQLVGGGDSDYGQTRSSSEAAETSLALSQGTRTKSVLGVSAVAAAATLVSLMMIVAYLRRSQSAVPINELTQDSPEFSPLLKKAGVYGTRRAQDNDVRTAQAADHRLHQSGPTESSRFLVAQHTKYNTDHKPPTRKGRAAKGFSVAEIIAASSSEDPTQSMSSRWMVSHAGEGAGGVLTRTQIGGSAQSGGIADTPCTPSLQTPNVPPEQHTAIAKEMTVENAKIMGWAVAVAEAEAGHKTTEQTAQTAEGVRALAEAQTADETDVVRVTEEARVLEKARATIRAESVRVAGEAKLLEAARAVVDAKTAKDAKNARVLASAKAAEFKAAAKVARAAQDAELQVKVHTAAGAESLDAATSVCAHSPAELEHAESTTPDTRESEGNEKAAREPRGERIVGSMATGTAGTPEPLMLGPEPDLLPRKNAPITTLTLPKAPKCKAGATPYLKLLKLATASADILPPFGVLRPMLNTDDEVRNLVTDLDDGYKLVGTDLKAVATALGETTCGLLFQALVVEGVAQQEAGTNQRRPLLKRRGSLMHVGRPDNAAGKGKIDLAEVPGGRAATALLAARALKVVQLLRIKIEDDGDLGQAKKTLANCRTFFCKLEAVGRSLGHATLLQTMVQMDSAAGPQASLN